MKVAKKHDVSEQTVESVVDNFFSVIRQAMRTGTIPSVYIKNFGEFSPSVKLLRQDIAKRKKFPDKFPNSDLENKEDVLDRILTENQKNKKNGQQHD